MRVNVYAEEMTDRVELISKDIEGQTFVGVRFYLELPVTIGFNQVRGPFLHGPGDDDSSAVTFWGKKELKKALQNALNLLNEGMDFKARLLEEKQALETKIKKLEDFIHSDKMNSVSDKQQSLLTLQLRYMNSYYSIVSERTADLGI